MTVYYAGIGSRETPDPILNIMRKFAVGCGRNSSYCLRSGHAKGADRAFEDGCDSVNGKKEIFTAKSNIPNDAFVIAETFHPAWQNCDHFVRKLHARNGMIILGEDLKTPIDFCIAYAPGDLEWGGTSQALRICKHYGIPYYNLFKSENVSIIEHFLESYKEITV